MMKLRKGPVCQGTLSDGSPCAARVDRPGDHCHVCLERLATSPDVGCRRRLAEGGGLPSLVFELLGGDPDHEVRLAVASRPDCPLVVLQELEQDEHADVRAAAAAGMSSAFRPRALHDAPADGLFTRAELDALGRSGAPLGQDGDAPGEADGHASPLDERGASAGGDEPGAPGRQGDASPAPAEPPARRPAAHLAGAPDALVVEPAAVARRRVRRFAPGGDDELLSGIDDVLRRLDAVTSRLGALETVLASAGDRLSAISERLDDLGAGMPGDPAQVAAAQAAVAAPAERLPVGREPSLLPVGAEPSLLPVAAEPSLLPVVHPAELASGPVIRADIVAAAWLAVLPLLARQRGRGGRGPGVTVPVPTEPVAGPFTACTTTAVAELLPGPAARATTAPDSWGRRPPRSLRRRHAAQARRRGSRR